MLVTFFSIIFSIIAFPIWICQLIINRLLAGNKNQEEKMKTLTLTLTFFLLTLSTITFAQDVPEYEVYAVMIAKYPDYVSFRFRDMDNPEIAAKIDVKIQELAPISFIYVKGTDVNLLYGPGPSEEALKHWGIATTDNYVDHKTLLDKLGVTFEQINYVVIDHMCFDHPGGMDLFPNATVIIEKGAFDHKDPLGFAIEEDFAKLDQIDAEGRLVTVNGDYDIAPGIKMYYAPGHTYATNFLAINTKDGTVIVTGDSVYTYLHLKYDLIPQDHVVTDSDLMLQSYEKIRQVMGPSDALLVPGHDM
jgi:glyoxylase-like metal-dependent hydrolase (beta-lactamase superfamily II)